MSKTLQGEFRFEVRDTTVTNTTNSVRDTIYALPNLDIQNTFPFEISIAASATETITPPIISTNMGVIAFVTYDSTETAANSNVDVNIDAHAAATKHNVVIGGKLSTSMTILNNASNAIRVQGIFYAY